MCLQNGISTKVVNDLTPFEVWYGYKPSLMFLRVFGCLCLTYIPQVKRDKLDKKAEAGILVGYNTISKAYRVFQPHTSRVIMSRDVHFAENEQWNWEELTKVNQIPNAPTFGSMLEESEDERQEESEDEQQDDLVDDAPVRGTRSLSDIYQRCNVAICEPAGFHDAKNSQHWMAAMQEELLMIEKNKTWKLVDRPLNRKIIRARWVFRKKLGVHSI